MKALALVGGPDHVCYRYRIEAFAWALAERELMLQAATISPNVWRRVGQFRRARHFDLVVLQRKLLPFWQLRMLRRASRCLIYDVDDAVYQRDSTSRKPAASWQRMIHYWATVYSADAVIAGNEFLRRRTMAYIAPDRLFTIPTCVEPKQYTLVTHRRTGGASRLVWIGQRSTLPSLNLCSSHLAAAEKALPGLELRVICDAWPQLPAVRIVPCRWSAPTEAADLSEGDIGINWLPDDEWSRGKCGLKVLQYMAAGLPVVANPVGMNCEMVLHGRTGFLASTPSQWAEAIARLASDPGLRQRMGVCGRRLVEQRFSVDRWGSEFARVVRSVVDRTAGRCEETSPASRPSSGEVLPHPLATDWLPVESGLSPGVVASQG
ncbi:MAG: glycosyltransferase family 4 protein [Pirellulales bacterium]|nr:glycosyltransferase family 4 protein [Pirellulales bacterium]